MVEGDINWTCWFGRLEEGGLYVATGLRQPIKCLAVGGKVQWWTTCKSGAMRGQQRQCGV